MSPFSSPFLIQLTEGQLNAVFGRVMRRGLTADQARAELRDSTVLRNQFGRQLTDAEVHNLFTAAARGDFRFDPAARAAVSANSSAEVREQLSWPLAPGQPFRLVTVRKPGQQDRTVHVEGAPQDTHSGTRPG